jgi:FMN reductase
MTYILTLSGSPSPTSRSTSVLSSVKRWLQQNGKRVESVSVRDIPADDLLHARFDSLEVQGVIKKIQEAQAVILATPVYKASFTGVLKALLDLLPRDALVDKPILPIAVGGTLAHLLVIDYALKPVLAALGAEHILKGIYVLDSQVQTADGEVRLDEEVEKRLQESLQRLSTLLDGTETDRIQETI